MQVPVQLFQGWKALSTNSIGFASVYPLNSGSSGGYRNPDLLNNQGQEQYFRSSLRIMSLWNDQRVSGNFKVVPEPEVLIKSTHC